MPNPLSRLLWLVATAALALALMWLDHNRGGPASMLSRCNLLLSRSASPPADVLILGSSRSGAALDPVAMQGMLDDALVGSSTRVERIALGNNPLRVSLGLLENYLTTRGAPSVIALEIMFMTRRSVDRLARRGLNVPPERYLFQRDLNLMTFEQILGLPSVAMPFTEPEGILNLWRFRLRGVVLRAGALVYQAIRRPTAKWQLSTCDRTAWTREREWPADFAFSYGDFEARAPLAELIDDLESTMTELARTRALKPWQSAAPTQPYPYDFEEPYRAGELALLRSLLELASRHEVPVVLLPLPLYGHEIDNGDLDTLADMLPDKARVFDLYGAVRPDLSKFWYDDGHIEVDPAGALTTALLARYLLDSDYLPTPRAETGND